MMPTTMVTGIAMLRWSRSASEEPAKRRVSLGAQRREGGEAGAGGRDAHQPLARARPLPYEHRPLLHRPWPPPHDVPSTKLDWRLCS